MLKIAIIIGSTRPNRVGESVARWVYEHAAGRTDAEFELIDIRDYNLPILDEPFSPAMGKYEKDHTKKWSETISTFDAFIFVTPEYNHGIAASLKNALDFLYKEWNNKVAGFVGYGLAGGTRAVEHLRLVLAELQIATVRSQVALSLYTDFENYTTFRPGPHHEKTLNNLFNQVLLWGNALKTVRK
jgi:NAD(P)H-dependent FMN reductase